MLITNSEFFCSFCGCGVTRDVDADVQRSGGATAYFCRLRCAQKHRLSGLNILSPAIKYQIFDAVKKRWDDKYIALDLGLSLAAVQSQAGAFRRELFPASVAVRKPSVARVPRAPKVVEEDDIFAPIKRRSPQQDQHEQRK